MRAIALGMAVLAFIPVAAFAHGPSRQKVTETVEINAPAAKVWKVIGNFQDMSWVPAVAKTEGTGGNEPKATRKLTLKSGGELEEELDKYDAEKMTYKYEMHRPDPKVFPVNDYSSILSVKPDGDDKSKVEWRGAFYRGFMNNDPPPELNDEAAKKAVSGLYRSTLDALKTKIEQGS